MKPVEDLKREVDIIKYEVDIIKSDVERVKDKLIDHTPEHFSSKDLVRATIGALFLGFSVLFSSNLTRLAMELPEEHFYIIAIGTILMLTAEIYVIGYSRVPDKNSRRFGQFWMKRLFGFYFTALVVALVLAYLFGIQFLVPTSYHFARVVVVLSAPCAIGASLGDLLKKY